MAKRNIAAAIAKVLTKRQLAIVAYALDDMRQRANDSRDYSETAVRDIAAKVGDGGDDFDLQSEIEAIESYVQ